MAYAECHVTNIRWHDTNIRFGSPRNGILGWSVGNCLVRTAQDWWGSACRTPAHPRGKRAGENRPPVFPGITPSCRACCLQAAGVLPVGQLLRAPLSAAWDVAWFGSWTPASKTFIMCSAEDLNTFHHHEAAYLKWFLISLWPHRAMDYFVVFCVTPKQVNIFYKSLPHWFPGYFCCGQKTHLEHVNIWRSPRLLYGPTCGWFCKGPDSSILSIGGRMGLCYVTLLLFCAKATTENM